MSEEIKLAPPCQCLVHQLEHNIIEFVEMLVDDKKCKEVDDWANIPVEIRDRKALILAVMAGALAEYLWKEGINPVTGINNYAIAWNKAQERQAAFDADPVGFKRDEHLENLKGYQS